MSRPAKSMKDTVREWAKTAPANELEAMRDMLEMAADFRGLGISEGDGAAFQTAKRGRPPGSRNRPKERRVSPDGVDEVGVADIMESAGD